MTASHKKMKSYLVSFITNDTTASSRTVKGIDTLQAITKAKQMLHKEGRTVGRLIYCKELKERKHDE